MRWAGCPTLRPSCRVWRCASRSTRPAVLSAVLGVVYRTISGHLLGEARLTRRDGHTGAITLIQRFGSAPRP